MASEGVREMSKSEDKYIKDPLIELLAIKLYEYDVTSEGGIVLKVLATSKYKFGWKHIAPEDREIYRAMARGEEPFYEVEDD